MSPRPGKKKQNQPASFSAFAKAIAIIEEAKKSEDIEKRKVVIVHDGMDTEQFATVSILIAMARAFTLEASQVFPAESMKAMSRSRGSQYDPLTDITTIVIPTGPGPDQNFTYILDHKKNTAEIKMPVMAEGEALGAQQIIQKLREMQTAVVKPDKGKDWMKSKKPIFTHTHSQAGSIKNVVVLEYKNLPEAGLMQQVFDRMARAHGHVNAVSLFDSGFRSTSGGENTTGPSVVVTQEAMKAINLSEKEREKGGR